ncbi:hypothetical protein [Sulfitobacter sp. S190]|uniref:hypothetical protein n=1 Tax=Sulfitobacter sp. S190 TaxID=2867022 RepID=UPI0021A27FC0|nr:hypothetical protein [Sulfitobacter sp. S190]UWR21333.1 hypothetical protein K3756_11495 [Sulfitobacter sp. S190]
MSDTDSFIDEVTDELRRDQLFAKMRRYAPIAVAAVLLLVGGAAYNEYRKASTRAEAEALGDAMLVALDSSEATERADALADISSENAQAAAVLKLLTASEQISADARAEAIANLQAVAGSGDVPLIYRQVAQFKALTLQTDTLPAADRRAGFDGLAGAGGALGLLAREQIALIEIEEGNAEAAIATYQDVLTSAEVTPDLQQRALQVIVALGGEPDFDRMADPQGAGAPTDETDG